MKSSHTNFFTVKTALSISMQRSDNGRVSEIVAVRAAAAAAAAGDKNVS